MNMQDIFAEDVGSGTPLVLVHGFLGSSDMWNLQINFLKIILELLLQHFQVLEKVIKLTHVIQLNVWLKQY